MIIWGDIHGMTDMFRRKMKEQHALYPDDTHIAVGDVGLGFKKAQSMIFPDYCKLIRGNHDSPEVARAHPNYLGDFGSTEIDGHKTFFVSGAWSIDCAMRIEGSSWWPEEELTIAELYKAHDAYVEYQPEIMITHDGPTHFTHFLLNRFALQSQAWYKEHTVTPTRTGQALTAMFDAFQPKIWVHGHWHADYEKVIKGTRFICVNELKHIRIEDLK